MTELIDRLKLSTTTLFGLPPSFADLDHEEKRMLLYAGLGALAVLWFAIALVEVWLLPLLPLSISGPVWFIRRRRQRISERGHEPEDWSY